MLSKPKNGWTTVTIKDFEAEASYLVDIPFDWLKTCLHGLQNRTPVALFIEEEGSECYITSYYEATYIVAHRRDGVACHDYPLVSFIDIAASLVEDIKKFFDDWVHWYPYEDSDADIQRRESELRELIQTVEDALEQTKETPVLRRKEQGFSRNEKPLWQALKRIPLMRSIVPFFKKRRVKR